MKARFDICSSVTLCDTHAIRVVTFEMTSSSSSFSSQALSFPPPPRRYSASLSLTFPLSSYNLAFTESVSSTLLDRRAHFQSDSQREQIQIGSLSPQLIHFNETSSTCRHYELSPSQRSHLYFAPSWAHVALLEWTSRRLPWLCLANQGLVRGIAIDRCHIDGLAVDSRKPHVLTWLDEADPTHVVHVDGRQAFSEVGLIWNSFAEVLDQTTHLTNYNEMMYRFSITYDFGSVHQTGLDGRSPVRITIQGQRCSVNASNGSWDNAITESFLNLIDWALLRPVTGSDFDVNIGSCKGVTTNVTYNPPMPSAIPVSQILRSTPPKTLSSLPLSFHSLVYATLLTSNVKDNSLVQNVDVTSSWIRSVQFPVTPATSSRYSLNARFITPDYSASDIFYFVSMDADTGVSTTHWTLNNHTRGSISFNVTNTSCETGRLIANSYMPLLKKMRPGSMLDVLSSLAYQKSSSKRMWLARLKYKETAWYQGMPCYRYFASFFLQPGLNSTYYSYNLTIYVRPTGWQSHGSRVTATASELVAWHNEGFDIISSSDNPICVPSSRTFCKLPRANHYFNDTFVLLAFTPYPVTSQEIWLHTSNCSAIELPPFPPLPSQYTSTISVSSSLTSQTYGFTEYIDLYSQRARYDGRYSSLNSVEVVDLSQNISILFLNQALDEGALGYGSRVPDALTSADNLTMLTTFKSNSGSVCTWIDFITSTEDENWKQWFDPTYYYYVERFPFSQWVHISPDTWLGQKLDQWQVCFTYEDEDGNSVFKSATLYFSFPQDATSLQIPVRFEFRSVLFNISTGSGEEILLENTVVNFVQFLANPDSLLPSSTAMATQYLIDKDSSYFFNPSTFYAPELEQCFPTSLFQRYAQLFSRLGAPLASSEENSAPIIALPYQFSAVLIFPLNMADGDKNLWSLRWYVDRISGNERLDIAPLLTSNANYSTARTTVISRWKTNVGTYTSSLTSDQCQNNTLKPTVLASFFAGTLPRLFFSSDFNTKFSSRDIIDGIEVNCYSTLPTSIINRHNANPDQAFYLSSEICFAHEGWVAAERGTQPIVVSVRDVYYDYPSEKRSELITYSFAMFNPAAPSSNLFDVEELGCQPSGLVAVRKMHDDSIDSSYGFLLPLLLVASLIFFMFSSMRYWHSKHRSCNRDGTRVEGAGNEASDLNSFERLGPPTGKLCDLVVALHDTVNTRATSSHSPHQSQQDPESLSQQHNELPHLFSSHSTYEYSFPAHGAHRLDE